MLIIYLIGIAITMLLFAKFDPWTEDDYGIDEYGNPIPISKEDHYFSDIIFSVIWPITLIGFLILIFIKYVFNYRF